MALKPGKTVQQMIKNVMQGKDEGAENSDSDEQYRTGRRVSSGIAGRVGLLHSIDPFLSFFFCVGIIYIYDICVKSYCVMGY